MDWKGFGILVLSSSLISTAISIFVSEFRSRNTATKENRMLALRFAFLFEDYAERCADQLANHDLAEQTDGNLGRHMPRVPELEIPSDGNFTEFAPDLLSKVFEFPHKIRMTNSEIAFMRDTMDYDDASSKSYRDGVNLALNALKIASNLRTTYGLNKRQIDFGRSDLRDFLAREHRETRRPR